MEFFLFLLMLYSEPQFCLINNLIYLSLLTNFCIKRKFTYLVNLCGRLEQRFLFLTHLPVFAMLVSYKLSLHPLSKLSATPILWATTLNNSFLQSVFKFRPSLHITLNCKVILNQQCQMSTEWFKFLGQ